MRMRLAMSLIVLAAAVSPLLAGGLAPVAPPQDARAIGAPALEILPQEFRPATPQDGLLWPKATVATAELSPGRKVLIAIDASTPEAAGPDVIRFNFAGAGNFGKSVALPLKPKSLDTWEFAQAVQVPLAGQELPAQIFGTYSRTGTEVNVQSARGGECSFGSKTYHVLLIDGNRNFNFNDATKVAVTGNLVTGVTFGDTLAVDTGDGSFKDATKVCLSFVGQPALVDGQWYDVAVSPEQASVSAVAAANVQAGQVQVAHPKWSATLLGRKYATVLAGAAGPMAVLADDYALANYQETAGSDVFVYTDVFAKVPGPLSVKVAPGQTLDLKMGTPLTAKMAVQVSGKQVTVNFAMTDAGGHAMSDVMVNGDRPDPPQYEVLNASGERVHQASMHYG